MRQYFGTILVDGKEYTLTKNPYVAGSFGKVYYDGLVEDEEGNEYRISWALKDGIEIDEVEDESDACDWDNPILIIAL
jgi:hypothetical protein